ncbi:sensor histidine kinase [Paenibacillus sp. N4]|uniref:sensor histidine kinase n=1 Tax=Paenibacillus vietnamensis TaxID=2590547 RepID=UPI001CD0F0F6|nr:histidine kinase [Paenibacillus vietnamensis]MCA0756247.1 sensor histidine kinase [Paenibacillus vietnamensis]
MNRTAKAFQSMKERLSRRLVNKLILLFTTIIILVVGSLTFISYRMLQKEAVEGSIASTSNNLLLVNRNLEEYLAGMEQLSLPQNRFDEIVYAINHESEDYASRMYVEDYLRELYYSRRDLKAIYLYVVKEKKYYAVTKENYNITVRTGLDTDISGLPWYGRAMKSGANSSYQSFVQGSGEETGYKLDTGQIFMAYHRVLRSIATREPQAVLSFYFTPAGRDDILKDVPFSEGQHLMYLSPDNTLFYADDPAVYGRMKESKLTEELAEEGGGRLTWQDGQQKYLVVYDVAGQSGWKLVKPIPYTQIDEAATQARNLSFSLGLAFLLLAVILVIYFSNAITRPLKKLSYQMNRFSAGDFDAEAEVKGRDEIAYLSRHFNQMVRRTNELINERYKMKLVEKNAILKALEAEINPHFLYNALQAISTKALKHETYDVADMVDSLALTLRYCISGKDTVKAREELKHIEHYLSLQKARFGSRLQVRYDWEESLMELEMPKLSIQTLVENAIKHAVEKVSSAVTIDIEARLDGRHAVISVRDDGPGFSPGRLEQVRESFLGEWENREHEGDSIGLVNLHTRLKLLYGDAAELNIKTDKSGTEMEMLLPRGGLGHVQSAHN